MSATGTKHQAQKPAFRKSQAGFSLIELITAIALLSLVLALITGLFVSTTRSTALAKSMDASTRVATNAMDEISRVLRVGTTVSQSGSTTPKSAFVYADKEALIVYSNVDVDAYASVVTLPPKPTMVKFALDAGRQLWESRWNGTASGVYWTFPAPATTPASARSLGGTVLAAAAGEDPFFTYYDSTGAPLVVPASGGLGPTQLANVASVKITLRIRANSAQAGNPVVINNTVLLPNLSVAKVTS